MEAYVKGVVVGKTLTGDLIVQTDLDENNKPKIQYENLVIISADGLDLPEQIVGIFVEVEGSIYFSDGKNVFLADEIRIRFPQHKQENGVLWPATIYRTDGMIETPEDREKKQK